MAYEDLWRIAAAFMDSYYRQQGFNLQKEELEAQRGFTERRLAVAEKTFNLNESNIKFQQALDQTKSDILEAKEGRDVIAAGEVTELHEINLATAEIQKQFAERVERAKIASFEASTAASLAAIAAAPTKGQKDEIEKATLAYNEIAQALGSALETGDYEVFREALINNVFSPAQIPSKEVFDFNVEQAKDPKNPDLLYQYMNKLIIDKVFSTYQGASQNKTLVEGFGPTSTLEDLLRPPSSPTRLGGGFGKKEAFEFFDIQRPQDRLPPGSLGPKA